MDSETVDKVPQRILADALSGGFAGMCVTPIVSAVDRALAENASGKCSLWKSFGNSFKSMVNSPIQYAKSPQFYFIWLVYGSTYVAVNATETLCKATKRDPAFPKWAASFTVNTSTCIAKDRAFAMLFSAANTGPVPIGSYGAWVGRDVISMGVFFTLPPIVGRKVAKYTGSEESGYYAAQIGLPLALQTITTPVHLVGYDIYNNPNNTFKQRLQFMAKDYWKNVSIRMVRMAPPWSFGTIGNRNLRRFFNDRIDE